MAPLRTWWWTLALLVGTASLPFTGADSISPSVDLDILPNSTEPAPWSGSKHQLSKRIQVDCSGDDLATLSAGWKQAMAIIAKANTAVQNIKHVLENKQDTYEYARDLEFRVQWATFYSIFGGFELGFQADDIKRGTMAAFIQDVATAFSNANANMQKAQTAGEAGALNVELRCSDSWLSRTDPNGKEHAGSKSFWWDTRDSKPDYQQDGWLDVGFEDDAICTGSKNILGFTVANLWNSNVDVITFCQNYFQSLWNEQQLAGETIADECAAASRSGRPLDDLVGNRIARTIVHELMHSINVADLPTADRENSKIDDQPCPDNEGAPAYAWQCITKLGSTRQDLASLNADSYAYFAIAVYCNQNSWATGWSLPPNSVDLRT